MNHDRSTSDVGQSKSGCSQRDVNISAGVYDKKWQVTQMSLTMRPLMAPGACPFKMTPSCKRGNRLAITHRRTAIPLLVHMETPLTRWKTIKVHGQNQACRGV
jgi:hypothetical protein